MVIDNFVITSSKGGSVGQQVFGSSNYTVKSSKVTLTGEKLFTLIFNFHRYY